VSEWPTTLVSKEACSRTASTIAENSAREAGVSSAEPCSKYRMKWSGRGGCAERAAPKAVSISAAEIVAGSVGAVPASWMRVALPARSRVWLPA